MVQRNAVPSGIHVSSISMEELFVFMVKEGESDMKGLLLKDWYMMKQYCRTYPVIAVAFMALSLVDSDNLFCILSMSALWDDSVILLGYEERSGWVQYSGTMPYTKNTNCFRKIPNQLVCPTYDARRYGNCASGKNDADGRFLSLGILPF